MERRRIDFSGRVQGVGFRVTARSAASGYPVTGWVRNEPDGSVSMEVQGENEAIEGFLADLRSRMGPQITGEQAATMGIDPQERSFEIRR